MTARNRGRRGAALALGSLVFLAAGAAAQAREYMTPQFLNKESRPMTLAVLPPHAEFIKSKAIMTDQMVKESLALEDAAADSIATSLKHKGYAVRKVTRKELEATPGLLEMVARLNKRYDEEWAKIVRKPRQVRQRRYGAGEDALEVSSLLKVDGIAIARIQAVGSTGGKQALTILLSLGNAYAQSYARLDLSVIEGKKGSVEGYFFHVKGCTLKTLINKPQAIMEKLADATLDDYPGSSEVKIVKGILPGEAAKDDDKEDEDAAIKDFEALIGKAEGSGTGAAPPAAPPTAPPDAPAAAAPAAPPDAPAPPTPPPPPADDPTPPPPAAPPGLSQ